MRRTLIGLSLAAFCTAAASAQDAPATSDAISSPPATATETIAAPAPTPTWRVNTGVSFGEVVTIGCSITFPSSKGVPSLRLRNASSKTGGPKGVARFDLSNADALLPETEGKIGGVKIDIAGQATWEQLDGKWHAATPMQLSQLSVTANPDIQTVLDPIAKGEQLTVTVPTAGGSKAFIFSLKESGKALDEYRACLAR